MEDEFKIAILNKLSKGVIIHKEAFNLGIPQSRINTLLVLMQANELIVFDGHRTWILAKGVEYLEAFKSKEIYLREPDTLTDLPINIPTKVDNKTQIETIQKGTFSKNIWNNEAILNIVYPLLVLMIGTILLKIFGVI